MTKTPKSQEPKPQELSTEELDGVQGGLGNFEIQRVRKDSGEAHFSASGTGKLKRKPGDTLNQRGDGFVILTGDLALE